jgi:hypothetical protein
MNRLEVPLDIEDVNIEAVEFTPNNEIIINNRDVPYANFLLLKIFSGCEGPYRAT